MEEEDKKVSMKILIVRTFPDKLDLNSYNVQEIGLAKALTMRGNQCDIVLYNGKDDSRKENYSFIEDGEEYSFFIYWVKGFALLKNGFMLSVKNILLEYDVIQVHEYDQIMSWMIYHRQMKPTVIYHGPYYHPYAKGYNLKCRVFDSLFSIKGVCKKIRVLTKSKMAAEFMQKKGFEKIVPVGVGINTDNFSRKKDKAKRKQQLLYVGKIEERRNVYFIIEVFRSVRYKIPGLQLVLVGNGEKKYKAEFLNFIQEEINSGEIIYKEKIQQKELADIYESASAFLFPSNYEIFGMVLLEAMYFGLPVISSMNGGASMLIQDGENGYVIGGFDVEEWSKKIESILLDEEKRNQMSQNAKMNIIENYTWDHLAEKFEIVYKQAIEEFEEDGIRAK